MSLIRRDLKISDYYLRSSGEIRKIGKNKKEDNLKECFRFFCLFHK